MDRPTPAAMESLMAEVAALRAAVRAMAFSTGLVSPPPIVIKRGSGGGSGPIPPQAWIDLREEVAALRSAVVATTRAHLPGVVGIHVGGDSSADLSPDEREALVRGLQQLNADQLARAVLILTEGDVVRDVSESHCSDSGGGSASASGSVSSRSAVMAQDGSVEINMDHMNTPTLRRLQKFLNTNVRGWPGKRR